MTRTFPMAALFSVAMTSFAMFSDGSCAMAAEIKVIGSPGVRGAVSELSRQFENTSGHKVVTDFAVIAVLKRRIEAGEAFDVVIPGPELIDDLIRQGKVAADTRVAFGRTGLGVGVRKGAPKPDISTVENLKRALLSAQVVAHSKEGQSGVHFLEVLNRLGIAQDMRPRLRTYDGNGMAVAMQNGEVDIAVSGMGPILELQGADFLGGLPTELQSYVRFAAGVSTTAKEPAAARALLQFLTSPTAAPVFKAKGLEHD
jgi:molybdate transport system substrate-binding protein